ncbi:MAG: hypothetical protein L6309_00620 [Candidatus Omnitrophica bacterium]|nr:hypothetical protein [Candidatus Omnitrophota bacterium]
MPIRKRITSKEAYWIKVFRSTLRVKNKIPLPTKTRLTLTSQKNKVPKIEDKNIKRTNDCLAVKPFLEDPNASKPAMAKSSMALPLDFDSRAIFIVLLF